MPDLLNAQQLIHLAQCLTRMQQSITDYELLHYPELNAAQKRKLETSLTLLAAAAGRMYAYSVQMVFQDADHQIQQLQLAAEGLKRFLKTAIKIQQVLDIASSVAALADAIISHDVESIVEETDQVIQMVANP